MKYVKLVDGIFLDYSLDDFRKETKSLTSSPSKAALLAVGAYIAVPEVKPEIEPHQKLVEGQPYLSGDIVRIGWVVSALSEAEIRDVRNKMLSETDWTQVADAPVDQAAWTTYRQALRDITTQSGFPHDVVWPTKPE